MKLHRGRVRLAAPWIVRGATHMAAGGGFVQACRLRCLRSSPLNAEGVTTCVRADSAPRPARPLLLGDELDSRAGIYRSRTCSERRPGTAGSSSIDRCLSCLAAATCPRACITCLVDHARDHIERPRPRRSRSARSARCRTAVASVGQSARAAGEPLPAVHGGQARADRRHADWRRPGCPRTTGQGGAIFAGGPRRPRALLDGCVGPVLALRSCGGHPPSHPPRHRGDRGEDGCCGALVHHMGRRPNGSRRPPTDRCLDRRVGGWSRCDRGHGLGLRHHGQD